MFNHEHLVKPKDHGDTGEDQVTSKAPRLYMIESAPRFLINDAVCKGACLLYRGLVIPIQSSP